MKKSAFTHRKGKECDDHHHGQIQKNREFVHFDNDLKQPVKKTALYLTKRLKLTPHPFVFFFEEQIQVLVFYFNKDKIRRDQSVSCRVETTENYRQTTLKRTNPRDFCSPHVSCPEVTDEQERVGVHTDLLQQNIVEVRRQLLKTISENFRNQWSTIRRSVLRLKPSWQPTESSGISVCMIGRTCKRTKTGSLQDTRTKFRLYIILCAPQ